MVKSILKGSYLMAVYLFLYIPIFVLIVLSFNSAQFGTAWESFTFDWYVKLFNNNQLITATLNSLSVATASATIATIIGTLAAVSLFRFDFFGKNFILTLVYIVMMSPDIVMGISLLMLFIFLGLPLGFQTLLITHITFSLPFVMISLFTRLSGFDRKIIEAAKDLGADEFKTFWYVILPNIMPAVLTGWVLSFTISMDDCIGSFFVTGPGYEILPLRIYSMVRLGIKPEVNALSAIIFVFSILCIVIAQLIFKEKKR